LEFFTRQSLILSRPVSETTQISTLSLHDALPIYSTLDAIPTILLLLALALVLPTGKGLATVCIALGVTSWVSTCRVVRGETIRRSEEHTSELQSREKLVCRLLLEKKKQCKVQIQR